MLHRKKLILNQDWIFSYINENHNLFKKILDLIFNLIVFVLMQVLLLFASIRI